MRAEPGRAVTSSPEAWAPLLVGVFALVVAAWKSWVPGLWYDEFVTLTMAQRSWSSLLSTMGTVDAVHAGYYSLMHLWLDVVPYSPFTLRLPSVVAVSLTAVAVTRIAVVQWNWVAGVAAGVVFVALPRVSWMATQARSYALATLLVTVTVMLFLRCLRDDRRRNWVAFGTSAALSMVVFVYAALVIAVLGAVLLLLHPTRDQRRRFLAATSGAACVALPLVVVAATQRGQIGWIDRTDLKSAVMAPYYVFLDGVDSIHGVLGWAILFLACAAALVLGRGHAAGPLNERATLVLVFGWLGFPGLVLLSVGRFLDVYHPAYVALSSPALALLVGGGLAARGVRTPGLVVILAIVAALAHQPWQFFREVDSKTPVLEVVSTIDALKRPGDAVWFVDGGTWDSRQLRYGYPETFTDLEDLTLDQTPEEAGNFFGTNRPIRSVADQVAQGQRIIGVVSLDEESSLALDADLSYLGDAGFSRVDEVAVDGWTVFVLDRP